MPQITVENLTFAYDGSYDNIFENVSFQLDTDWKLGFTGRNGRGKTTFLKLLCGEYEYSGKITASTRFEYFPYEVEDGTLDTLSVAEQINPELEQWRLIRELSQLEVGEDVLYRPFNTLSSGEQTKVLLAVMFTRENSFLLIDEPTNHLDIAGRELVAGYLRSKKGFILVSHDRAFMDGCIDHILSINRMNIEIQRGNFSSWWANKEARDSFEREQNDRLKGDIRRLKEAARRTSQWSDKVEKTKHGTRNSGLRPDRGHIGAQSAKLMQRSKNIEARRESAAEEKSKLLRNVEENEELRLSPEPYHSARLAEIKGLSVYYGERQVCSDVTFEIMRGDRIAVSGRNGAGKSSLLKLLCGEDIKHTGSLKLGSGLTVSYVPQGTSHLSGSVYDYAEERGLDTPLFLAILRKLGFERVQFEKDMSDYSGGQKKKVLIAESLCLSANLYIWDEPLNFIDVFSRMQLEELLLEYKPTIVFVEHDRMFSDTIATKRVEL